jgi:hypothetical protein
VSKERAVRFLIAGVVELVALVLGLAVLITTLVTGRPDADFGSAWRFISMLFVMAILIQPLPLSRR